jgi:hypothetical protein
MKPALDAASAAAPQRADSFEPAPNAPRVVIRHEGRSVTSSAQRRRKPWLLRGEPEAPPPLDPLMGWCGQADTHAQIELRFATLEEAIAFASRRGWRFDVVRAAWRPFAEGRAQPWPASAPLPANVRTIAAARYRRN